MVYEHIRYEQDGPVAVVTIDRPERMNAIGPRTADELRDAWSRVRDDDDALVGILTGAGEGSATTRTAATARRSRRASRAVRGSGERPARIERRAG